MLVPAPYDAFADFYNRDWGLEYHAQIMALLDRLLLSDLEPGSSILDVGCGTGTVAAQLLRRGFSVTGIDQSEKMLEFARANAPSGRFIQGDASNFRLDSACDAAIATFEAMNHLLEPLELQASFRCIARATRRVFVLDMNRESAFDVYWNGESVVEQDGLRCKLSSSYNPITQLAVCRTDVNGSQAEIFERYYDTALILNMLEAAGFRTVNRFDAKRDLGMTGSVAVGRFFYQCFL